MSTHSTGSQLATAPPTSSSSPSRSHDSEKAWHLLSLLLSFGRPSSPLQLASKCELFPASPDLIRRLCDIPSSPIHLTDDHLVMLSFAALISVARFLTNSNLVSFFCSPQAERLGLRKRGGSELECEVSWGHIALSGDWNVALSWRSRADLYDTQSLASMNLRNWCRKNTKRPDFLDVLPESLFDLVDRCLTVNPRARISAEEALRREFFAPCREELRKQKLLRLGFNQDLGLSPRVQTNDHQPRSVASQSR